MARDEGRPLSLFGKSSEPRGPRTAEDRERARLEREARRRQRGGNPYGDDGRPGDNGGAFFDQDDPLATSQPTPAIDDVDDHTIAEPPPPDEKPVWEDVVEIDDRTIAEPPPPGETPPWEEEPAEDETV